MSRIRDIVVTDETTVEELAQIALQLWGYESQVNMAVEECSELILASRHLDRGKATLEDFMREVADVEIMMAEMKAMFNDPARYEELKAEKIDKFREHIRRSIDKRKDAWISLDK